MLKQLQKKDQKGFTIIEVLIVLAIAGLILLVVFLAVPALQRSGRNTTIKNDAQAVAGGISDFASNNGGVVPTKAAGNNGVWTFQTATIANGGTAKLQGTTTVQGSTTAATFAVTTPATTNAANPSAGAIYVDSGESCQSSAGAPTKSTRAFAVYYWTETPGVTAGVDATTGIYNGAGLKGQCIDS